VNLPFLSREQLKDFLMVKKPTYEELEQKVKAFEEEIAKFKYLEEELIKAHNKVEKQAAERTTKLLLTNKNLRQEIKKRKHAEQARKERETELEFKKINLEEVNTALKVLLKRSDEGKTEIEEKVLLNVRKLIMPYFEKLKISRLNDEQKTYVDIIDSNLNEIISSFVRSLSSIYWKFTSTEIQIANLVTQSRTTKEIANLLNLAVRTIESYRDNIRKKLGIKNKQINLRSYLLSIQ
jgi:DNA-binding CsgD family transcriptional regulator